jgi:hypothetical protein
MSHELKVARREFGRQALNDSSVSLAARVRQFVMCAS